MSAAYQLTTIAETGDRFADFAPYVPCIDERGAVAFQARLVGGETVVCRGRAGALRSIGACPDVTEVLSHPDIDERGGVSYYAALSGAGQGLVVARGAAHEVAVVDELTDVGPLGPTMNASGQIAFRAHRAGRPVIATHDEGRTEILAEATAAGDGFEGLPVINGRGAVAYRAFHANGVQSILLHRAGRASSVVDTCGDLAELGRFPFLADDDGVLFCAVSRAGEHGIYRARDGELTCLLEAGTSFASLRGVLAATADQLIYYGTPVGANLGVFSGPDPLTGRIIGIGDVHRDDTITGFALNPVSINGAGQLAIRLQLASGAQSIVRADC